MHQRMTTFRIFRIILSVYLSLYYNGMRDISIICIRHVKLYILRVQTIYSFLLQVKFSVWSVSCWHAREMVSASSLLYIFRFPTQFVFISCFDLQPLKCIFVENWVSTGLTAYHMRCDITERMLRSIAFFTKQKKFSIFVVLFFFDNNLSPLSLYLYLSYTRIHRDIGFYKH